MDMKSLQLQAIGSLVLRQMPVPEPGPGEVLLKVTHCAVCRTDAKMWERGQRDLVMPRVLGHEICGVREPGGGRCIAWPGSACGKCAYCQDGLENLCPDMQITGFHKDGGFAEYISVPQSGLIPLPDNLDSDIACLAEPAGCTLNAVEQAGINAGDTVLIYGAGPVGLLMGLTIHAQGAIPYITDINPTRLMQSKSFCEHVGIRQLTDDVNFQFDRAVNAAPSADTFPDGLFKLRKGGCFCLFSGLTSDTDLPVSVLNEIHYRQLHVVGAYGCTRRQMKNALEILENYQQEARQLIEAHITLEQVPDILPKILAGEALKFVVEIRS